jgi:predicted TIM-barrel fold metal-dependent hydrolase
MVDRGFSWNKVEQVVKRLVGMWGEDRVMLASNAPLLNWRMGYHEYWDTLVVQFSSNTKLLSENAFRAYF